MAGELVGCLLLVCLAAACMGADRPAGASTTGTAIGGPVRFDAGANDGFGSLALAASADEAELFFAQAQVGGGYQFLLQHLTPGGAAVGPLVKVATGLPHDSPSVAVDCLGSETACCWDDFGLNPNAILPSRGMLIQCNSIHAGGTATDGAMDGGFVDFGYLPSIAHSGLTTIAVYSQDGNRGVSQEFLYQPWGYEYDYPAPYLALGWQIVAGGGGFQVILSDGGALAYGTETANLRSDGGLQAVPNGAAAGSFAAASIPPVTAIALHQGSTVGVTMIGASAPALIAISSSGEQPLDPLAAAACNSSSFAFAYADDGGDLMFREVSGGAAAGSTTIANLGTNVQTIGMTAVDGGVLVAAGTPTAISVYAVPCP
jgi:hypothetical protein